MIQDTRKKLLEGAHRCLVEQGFQGTTVKAIAKYAGVNHGLVHHYFGSKEELLAALVEKVAQGEGTPAAASNNKMSQSGDVATMSAEQLETFVKKRIVPHLTSDYNKFVTELLVMSEEMPLVARQVRKLLNRRREWFGLILGVKDSSQLLLISGALMGLMLQYKLDPALNVEDAVVRLFRLISKQEKRSNDVKKIQQQISDNTLVDSTIGNIQSGDGHPGFG
ncbi:MAG: TetR/AcrR family transcriptional regulator [SAR324 cluster bacterium]|nr:TetR/AcrR family transcriptional regulator [SAR324 cluster bacterium]